MKIKEAKKRGLHYCEEHKLFWNLLCPACDNEFARCDWCNKNEYQRMNDAENGKYHCKRDLLEENLERSYFFK